jgi:hypothetical protein
MNDPPHKIHLFQRVSIAARTIDSELPRCWSDCLMKALIFLAVGKRPEAVIEVDVIPAVGAHMTVDGTCYEVIGVGHAFDLDASGKIVHMVEIEVRILIENRPS